MPLIQTTSKSRRIVKKVRKPTGMGGWFSNLFSRPKPVIAPPVQPPPPPTDAQIVAANVFGNQPYRVPVRTNFASNILRNQPRRPVGYIPIEGQTYAAPQRPVLKLKADFSMAPGVRVPVSPVAAPSQTATYDPWLTELAEGPLANKTKTSGQTLQESLRGRLYETSSGLVVAEGPEDYAEENSFWSQGSQVDPLIGWMDTNDRSSASTTLSEVGDLQEFGGGDMRGFGMDGLASYEDYKGNGGYVALANDLLAAFNNVTSNGSHLERLTKDSIASEMTKMGYPANEIDGLINVASNFLPSSIKDKLFRAPSRGSTTTTPPSQQGSTSSHQQGSTQSPTASSIPKWLPLAAVGVAALYLYQRSRA